jgi:dihydropteroate synthase
MSGLHDRLNPLVLRGSRQEHLEMRVHRMTADERLFLAPFPGICVEQDRATLAGGRAGIEEFLRAAPPDLRAAILSALAGYFDGPPRARLGEETLPSDRTLIMGILNVTPDSFYDGGRHNDAESAVAAGLKMAEQGADVIDVGPESTRPGSEPVEPQEQIQRAVPVIRQLAARGLRISVDTSSARVAREALAAGARMVNDVRGLAADPGMIPAAAESKASVVISHIRGEPRTMQNSPRYDDVVEEVTRELRRLVAAAREGGIGADRIWIDPGLGFGKRFEDNLALLNGISELRSLGIPIVVGASRKSFIGRIMGKSDPGDRLTGSLAAAAWCAWAGARMVRVHDVAETRDALAVIDRVRSA